ncbi:MAG TPA: hypothetical protein VMB52_01235 [Verrucomicrobiae bacterium]|nr:hypothetical protein [Verrucomicrobiae bacterium]
MRPRKHLLATILLIFLVLPALIACFSGSASAATCATLPTDKGTVSTTFTVTSSGSYRLWAHVYTSPEGSALYVMVDNNCPAEMGGSTLPTNTFSWVGNSNASSTPITLNLTSGKHTITIAGQDPNVGIDQVVFLTNSTCTPTGNGSNCEASAVATINGSGTSTSGHTSVSTTPVVRKGRQTLSAMKLTLYTAIAAIAAALIAVVLLRYAAPLNSVLRRIWLFKGGMQPQPQMAGQQSPVTVMSGVKSTGVFSVHRSAILFVLGFGVAGGVLTFIALAATDYNVVVSLTDATVSGQAHIVANTSAINGQMVQFGSGASTTSSGATSSKPSTTTPSTSTPPSTPTSPHSTSSSSHTTSTSSTAGSSSGSSSSGSGSITIPAASNCTNPNWSGSGAEDTDSISDTWWVNNDAWSGSHGPQTINVCSQSSWYAVSNQPDNGGQVETYPDTEYDVGGRSTPSTKTIAQWNSITSTFSEAYPSAGSWDAAYDLWTDNWTNETMIWNQWTGSEDYWGSCAEPGSSQNDCVGPRGASNNSQAATLDGVAYHFLALGSNCSAATEANCEYIFFKDSQVASGSVNILAAWQWEVANGYAKSSDVPTQMEYGVEVCSTSGSETFPMTGLTFSLN